MKHWLLAILFLFACSQADAQFFKKKKKQPADSTAVKSGFKADERKAAAAPTEEEPALQELSIDDLIEIMDNREDSAAARSKLIKAGFNRNARADKNQIVYMGDTARGVTKYTEMVFVQSDGKEIQLLQFCTRHPEKFQSIRRDLRTGKMFTGQPSLTEDEELSEAYYTRDYQILLESYSKKTRFVISIWVKGAKLPQ